MASAEFVVANPSVKAPYALTAFRPYYDEVISDYIGFTFADLVKIVSLSRK